MGCTSVRYILTDKVQKYGKNHCEKTSGSNCDVKLISTLLWITKPVHVAAEPAAVFMSSARNLLHANEIGDRAHPMNRNDQLMANTWTHRDCEFSNKTSG